MHNKQFFVRHRESLVVDVTGHSKRRVIIAFFGCIAFFLLFAKQGYSDSRLSMPEDTFLRVCGWSFNPSLSKPSLADGQQWTRCFHEEMETALTVYFEAIIDSKYYDPVTALLCQESRMPFIPRPVIIKPFVGELSFGKPEIAARFPMAERMAFIRLVLNTTDPFDRGAYHAIVKGKEKELEPLREWVKTHGKLDDPVSQEAIRALAEVDIAAFLRAMSDAAVPYQADNEDAVKDQFELAHTQLNSQERIDTLEGLGRLFKLECEHPELDLDTLWALPVLSGSPLKPWIRENRVLRLATHDYAWRKFGDMPLQTKIPGKLLENIYRCDAWYNIHGYIGASPESLRDALLLSKGESPSQYLATSAVWVTFFPGGYRPEDVVSLETMQPLARFADSYLQNFRSDKTLLPTCLILYFPFLRARKGFETQYKAAWELYTQMLQSDSPGLRCRALNFLSNVVGQLPTPEGDMVRKTIEREMQAAINDGDLCHLIAVSAAAQRTGMQDSLAIMAPTVP